jgi:hypothetical protein
MGEVEILESLIDLAIVRRLSGDRTQPIMKVNLGLRDIGHLLVVYHCGA